MNANESQSAPGQLPGDKSTEERTPIDEEEFDEVDEWYYEHIHFILGEFAERYSLFFETVLKRWGYVQVATLTWKGETSGAKLAAIRLLDATNNRNADAWEDLAIAEDDEDEAVRAAATALLDRWQGS